MDEERIALFIDYENLAIGAREHLGQKSFDFGPIADALAERGRVVVRRAYADWSYFSEDRRDLTRHHIELIEIPQKMGMARKNAADIKLVVDAVEMSYERGYISTFVICTGDSDFTPLVHKLREHNKQVIGIGIEGSTSNLLPPACDEFLFYDRLAGLQQRTRRGRSTPRSTEPQQIEEKPKKRADVEELDAVITRTLSGLKRTSGGAVLSSHLKRTLLRKDPTFDESEYGFRSFGELLQNLAERKVVQINEGQAKGDPEVEPARTTTAEQEAFELLREIVSNLGSQDGPPQLAGLKNEMRKRKPRFSEKRFGYGGFLQFVKAARARGLVDMEWDEASDDYRVRPAGEQGPATTPVPEETPEAEPSKSKPTRARRKSTTTGRTRRR